MAKIKTKTKHKKLIKPSVGKDTKQMKLILLIEVAKPSGSCWTVFTKAEQIHILLPGNFTPKCSRPYRSVYVRAPKTYKNVHKIVNVAKHWTQMPINIE